MESVSLKRILFILTVIVYGIATRSTASIESKLENTTHNCPFTRIIEDIFNINNRSSNREANLKDKKTNYLFNSTKSLSNESISKSIEDELVNDIIASIKRIKANLTNDSNKLNEAIILKVPKDKANNSKVVDKKVNQIKSGIEDKIDVLKTSKLNQNEKYKMDDAKVGFSTPKKPISQSVKSNYVEILTVEPNNTNINNKSTHNILEVLKNIMPALNVTKDLHSITIIERNQNKNHSFSETKNISTIIVKYCEKENSTKNNTVTKLKHPDEEMKTMYVPEEDEDYNSDDDIDYEDQDKYLNRTSENRREVLVAAEYGIQKMHELYGVLEPKLYSMGLVLDEKDPARYVAAFNAPSEDSTMYAKYGYASLQAATKLKELISGKYREETCISLENVYWSIVVGLSCNSSLQKWREEAYAQQWDCNRQLLYTEIGPWILNI